MQDTGASKEEEQAIRENQIHIKATDFLYQVDKFLAWAIEK